MNNFDSKSTPPNWNGSLTGIAGYWEWRDGVNGWRWFDETQETKPAKSKKMKTL